MNPYRDTVPLVLLYLVLAVVAGVVTKLWEWW